MELKDPIWLWLFLPLVFGLFLFSKNGLKRKEDKLVLLLRGCLMTILILALTNPLIVLPENGQSVIFLADRSASVSDQEEKIIDLIAEATKTKRESDRFGVVSFGEDSELDRTINEDEQPFQQFSTQVKDGETNLIEGLDYSSTLLNSYSGSRIVAITDGKETMGLGEELLPLLKEKNIEVDWIPLKSDIEEDVAVTDISTPSIQYEDEEASIKVTLFSTQQQEVEIRISLNDQPIIKERVKVQEGENEFQFEHNVTQSGLIVYKAEVIAQRDGNLKNNSMLNIARSEGPAKVLVVDNSGNDSPLLLNLKSAGFKVDQYIPEQLPNELTSYLQYQAILFNNVSATTISENKMLQIEKAVKEFGRGFIMFGGNDSFALGGYFKTPIERLLPVDMDIKGKKELPSLGLVILLDRSGSMSGQKIALAKEAAARTVKLLREKDTLGVIAFDDRPWEIVKTQALTDRKKAEKQIRSISPGGGTEIFTSLQQAYKNLEKLPLKRKHIILLTDGQSAASGNYQTLVRNGESNHITLSTVAIGEGADRGLLDQLSQWGKGRFYDVTDASVIPSILTRETVITTRTYIEDTPFYPTIRSSKWKELFQEGVPQMNAYIATSLKGTAQGEIQSEKDDPVLAYWRYGLGSTFAFTSDTSGKWAGDFAKWKQWPMFINQLVTRSFPSLQSNPYSIEVDNNSEATKLLLTSSEGDVSSLDVTVLSQNGKTISAETRIKAPGEYEVEFENRLLPGLYNMRISKKGEEIGSFYETGFSVPYSKEYSSKGGSTRSLEKIVKQTGGSVLTSSTTSFRDLKTSSSIEKPIQSFLIAMGFLLFFFEIAIRRFGLSPVIKTFNKIKWNKPSNSSNEKISFEKLKYKVRHESLRPYKENVKAELKHTSDLIEKRKEDTVNKKKTIKSDMSNFNTDQEEKNDSLKRLLEAKKRREK